MATRNGKSSFSISKAAPPRLKSSQVRIKSSCQQKKAGIAKPTHKLEMRRSGKIGYSK